MKYLLEKNKLFVHMDKSVPVQVKLESYMPGLFLRALLVFVRDDDLKDSVRRCFIHVALDNPSNKGYENILDHVIRCEDPAAVYNHNTTSGRYSVVVPITHFYLTLVSLVFLGLPQSCLFLLWAPHLCHPYYLGLRLFSRYEANSVSLPFIIPHPIGTVVGRNSLNVRVCSCPKRDCAKEEKDLAKAAERGDTPEKYCKRVAATNTTRLATKRKNETDTDTIQLVCAAKHAKMLAGMLHAFHKFADDIKPETKTLVMSQLEGIMAAITSLSIGSNGPAIMCRLYYHEPAIMCRQPRICQYRILELKLKYMN
uniref:p53 DNA-binding domain-containing protein n=1 Tax=Timema bartmani TaxID=61472 RepID=A0A7R9F917_9NEOP|nr:unnamed protein product [Timema bartmani]